MKREGLILPNNIQQQNVQFVEKICGKASTECIENKFISLDYFRELYTTDLRLFNSVVREANLRGGIFKLQSFSPLFPKNKIEHRAYIIHVPEGLEELAYQKLNFSVIGLNHTMNTFHITSNDFFHGIPIEGFLNLNVSMSDIKLLIANFEDAGFEIDLGQEKRIENTQIAERLEVYRSSSFLSNVATMMAVFGETETQKLQLDKHDTVVKLGMTGRADILNQMDISQQKKIAKQLKYFYEDKSLMALLGTQMIDQCLKGENDIVVSRLFVENKWNMLNNALTTYKVYRLSDFNYERMLEVFHARSIGVLKIIGMLDVLYDYLVNDDVKVDLSMSSDRTYFVFSLVSNTILFGELVKRKKYMYTYKELIEVVNQLPVKNKEKKRMIAEIDDKISDDQITKVEIEPDLVYKHSMKLADLVEMFAFSCCDSSMIKEELELVSSHLDQSTDSIFNKTEELNHVYEHIVNMYYEQIIRLCHVTDRIEAHLNDDRKAVIFKDRIQGDKTLEEVGTTLNVTRERVRQLELKEYKALINIMNENGLTILLYLIDKKHVISPDLFCLSDKVISLLHRSQEGKGYVYLPNYHVFVSDSFFTLLSKFKHMLNRIIDKKSYITQSKISDWLDNINDPVLTMFVKDHLNEILAEEQLVLYEDVYIKNNIGKAEVAVLLLSLVFENQTMNVVDEKDIKQFYDHYVRFFEDATRDLEGLSRSVIGFFERSSDRVIKIASNTYKILDIEKMPTDLIDEAVEFVRSELVEEDAVYLVKICRVFANQMHATNLQPFELYYYLKLFYAEEFNFGSGNTMRIYGKDTVKMTTEEIIYNKILRIGEGTSVTDLCETLGIERHTVEQTAATSDRIAISNGKVTTSVLSEKDLSPMLLDKVKELSIEMLDKEGYLVVKKLYDILIFDAVYGEQLVQSNIHTPSELLQILKLIIPNIKGQI